MKARVLVLAAVVAACIVLSLGGVARLGPVEAARAGQGAHTCQNIQLLVQAQSSQGAAGTIAILYRLHNMWSQACSLTGYPGVQLLDRNFLSLPTTLHRGGGMTGNLPVRTVQLGGGGNAYFALFYSDVPVGNQPCAAAAHYVMIIAPNDRLPVVTYASTGGGTIRACTGNVYVTPVTAQPKY